MRIRVPHTATLFWKSYTWDRTGYENSFYGHYFRNERQQIVNTVQKYLDIKKESGIVVDVGCGTGIVSSEISQINGANVIGVDISLTALLKENNSSGNIQRICADAYHLPFRKGVIDVVVNSEILPHLAEPEIALQKMYNMLKQDGIIVGGVTAGEKRFQILIRKHGYKAVAGLFEELTQYMIPRDSKVHNYLFSKGFFRHEPYTRKRMLKLLETTNFKKIKINSNLMHIFQAQK